MPPKVTRRRVIQSVGTGSSLAVLAGVAGANGNNGKGNGRDKGPDDDNPGGGPPSCPECAEGTRLLAKYEFEDDEGFVFEKGACDDVLSDLDYTNKPDEDNEPIEVRFSSTIYVDDVIVKYGPNCEVASESDAVSFDQDGEKDADGFEGTITLENESGPAISYFTLCAGVCYQADFVIGDPIDDLGEDQYGPRLISYRWGGTTDGGPVDSNNFSPKTTNDGDTITVTDDITFADGEATVTFSIDLASEAVTVSLVSYTASCPAIYDEDTASLQDLHDSSTHTFTTSIEDETVTIGIPGLAQLDELCALDE